MRCNFDTYMYIYMPHFLGFKNNRNVSYTGHALGGLAGLLVGSILLENRKVRAKNL